MKKRIMGVALGLVVGVSVLVGSASAAPTSDNANSNACFGQGRAYYASTYKENGPNSNGFWISQRKGKTLRQCCVDCVSAYCPSS